MAELLLCLSPAEVANLKEGINFVRNKSTGKDYILYKSKSLLRACKNMCKHQGGLFIKDIEDLDGRSVRCTKHNWKLDVSTMKYINPPGSFCQDELVVEESEENELLLLELNPPNPWDSEPRSPEDLAFGEVPNGGRLPMKVDLMMSDFAGGASGFPMTFSGGKFTEEWKAQFIKTERKKLLNYKARLVKDLQPRIYCPFAGYIKETNIKNDPDELNNLIKKNSDVLTWTPRPGATLDLGRMLKDPTDSKGIIDPPEGTKIYKDSWDFGPYLKILNAAVGDEIFHHPSWIKEYFTWAGFKDYNLVVRMIETDEDFSPFPGGYDYLVDFLDLSFPKERPSREHPYEEIRSRVDVIRHVVKNGLLWDDLYIGFQTRLQRDPDIYHHLFWNHFQIKLPLTPPNWKSFLIYCGERGPEISQVKQLVDLGDTFISIPSHLFLAFEGWGIFLIS
uniref:Rieske domain-containing protein n=1 Tax=Capra hircus TaxID=9925 RepID=A0A8C2RVG7_CAPHI